MEDGVHERLGAGRCVSSSPAVRWRAADLMDSIDERVGDRDARVGVTASDRRVLAYGRYVYRLIPVHLPELVRRFSIPLAGGC